MKFKEVYSIPLLEASDGVKIYHTETQDDFDSLMIELERKGCKWIGGRRPTEGTTSWKIYSSETCIKVDKRDISYMEKSFCAEGYPDIPIIKYKAVEDDDSTSHYYSVAKEIKVYQIDLQSISKGSIIRYREKGKDWVRGLVKSVDRDRISIARSYGKTDSFSAKSIGIGDVDIKVDYY